MMATSGCSVREGHAAFDLQAARALLHECRSRASTSSFDQPKLEQMLRNFRLRRRLGLLPGSAQSAVSSADALVPRWLRQELRPHSLVAMVRTAPGEVNESGGPRKSQQSPAEFVAELQAEVSELQLCLDRSYSELNAERRSHGALAEGLRRQGSSVAAIVEESARLRAQLEELRHEVQRRVDENGQLNLRLKQKRQDYANSLSQAALLSTAVGGTFIENEKTVPNEGATDRILADIATCRVQIASLIEENEALERCLECPGLGSAYTASLTSQPPASVAAARAVVCS